MTIPARDIKILWSKAAGMCSMPDCRINLVAESSGEKQSRNALIGENCHIVATKTKGPRGKSVLSKADRDRYSNLILLCKNHHGEIDQNPADWPVELLHKVKSDHELWVETQLRSAQLSKSDEWYITLVESATKYLKLESWDGICDHAIRGILWNNFVEGSGDFGTAVFRSVWPEEKAELERAIKNLSERIDQYVKHFLSMAYLRDNKVWVEDKEWKKKWRNDYDEYVQRSKVWQQTSVNLLSNVVVALNEYADAVRAHLINDYLIFQGKFTLYDSMGVTNELREVHYMPSDYIDVGQ